MFNLPFGFSASKNSGIYQVQNRQKSAYVISLNNYKFSKELIEKNIKGDATNYCFNNNQLAISNGKKILWIHS